MNIKPLIDTIKTDKLNGGGVVSHPVRDARKALVSYLSETALPTVAAAREVATNLRIDWGKDPGEDALLAWAWTVDALHHEGRIGDLLPVVAPLLDPLRAAAEARREEVRLAGRDDARTRPIDVSNWP